MQTGNEKLTGKEKLSTHEHSPKDCMLKMTRMNL